MHAGCGVKGLARSPFSTRIAAPIALLLPSSALFAAFSGAIAVVLLTFPAEFIGPPAVGHSYIRTRSVILTRTLLQYVSQVLE